MTRTAQIQTRSAVPAHTHHSRTSTQRAQAPATAKGRGSLSLEAPFRLCGKPLSVPALPETIMGAGSGVTLSSIRRVKERFLANVYKSGCVCKHSVTCALTCLSLCSLCSLSDSCVRVLACFAYFCVFLRAGHQHHQGKLDNRRQRHALLLGPCRFGRDCLLRSDHDLHKAPRHRRTLHKTTPRQGFGRQAQPIHGMCPPKLLRRHHRCLHTTSILLRVADTTKRHCTPSNNDSGTRIILNCALSVESGRRSVLLRRRWDGSDFREGKLPLRASNRERSRGPQSFVCRKPRGLVHKRRNDVRGHALSPSTAPTTLASKLATTRTRTRTRTTFNSFAATACGVATAEQFTAASRRAG